MGFIIRLPGEEEIDCDDFTLDEVDQIERETEVYWVLAHPWRSAKVAKAFLRVAFQRLGRDPKEADDLRLRDVKKVFDYKADPEEAEQEERPTKARKGRSQSNSSGISPSATTGPLLSAASSG